LITENLPLKFHQRIKSSYRAEGAEWLEALPVLIGVFAERWSLTLQPPFEGMTYNELPQRPMNKGRWWC
jgi:hypothetical protein